MTSRKSRTQDSNPYQGQRLSRAWSLAVRVMSDGEWHATAYLIPMMARRGPIMETTAWALLNAAARYERVERRGDTHDLEFRLIEDYPRWQPCPCGCRYPAGDCEQVRQRWWECRADIMRYLVHPHSGGDRESLAAATAHVDVLDDVLASLQEKGIIIVTHSQAFREAWYRLTNGGRAQYVRLTSAPPPHYEQRADVLA